MIKAIVTDIEGTTSSLSFVRDVLFPYAAEHIPRFVQQHRTEAPVRTQLNATADLAGLPRHDTDDLVRQLKDWIASDTKATPLKALQGMVWRRGYESGDYQAHIYADAVRRLRDWFEQRIDLYVFSSGSIEAQKLFFQYSRYGDMRPLFRGYFDTTTGAKHEEASYRTIAETIGMPASDLLFLSDTEAELDAAGAAGYRTGRLLRPEDYVEAEPDAVSRHPTFASFDDIDVTNFD